VGERNSGFWSGFGAWVTLEAATWVLFLLGAGLVSALKLPWGWNVAVRVVFVAAIVIAIVLAVRRYGGRRRR
jgi:hypothetical protein